MEEIEVKQSARYIPRNISHNKFKNVTYKRALELLKDEKIGEVIIRPSSKGEDHLTLTWKFADNCLVHLDLREEDKPDKLQLGRQIFIGNEVFEDLSDIIHNYIDVCTR